LIGIKWSDNRSGAARKRRAGEVQVAEKAKVLSPDSPFVEWLTASILLASCVALALTQLLAR
jgi:hypothetical protein